MSDTPDQERLLKIHLSEYSSLKGEQMRRIGFRDNLLYVTLSLYGGIFSYAISDTEHYYAFLVLPWVCFVLGWTYLVNDEKISAIGRYIRLGLTEKLASLAMTGAEELCGWETAHRSDKHRVSRKRFQLLVDEVTFSVSGMLALGVFIYVSPMKTMSGLQQWGGMGGDRHRFYLVGDAGMADLEICGFSKRKRGAGSARVTKSARGN